MAQGEKTTFVLYGTAPEAIPRKERELTLEEGKHRLAKRAQAFGKIQYAESIISGKSVYGVLIKWFVIILFVLFVVIGPGMGAILQMGAYLDKQLIFWILGIGALILYLRRR